MIGSAGRAFSVAIVLVMAFPAVGLAHEPTGAPYANSWTTTQIDNGPSAYKWDASVPAWLKAPMNDVLQVAYADEDFNNSDSIRFAYGSGGSATVLYKPRYDPGVPSDCQAVNWQGCANGAGSWSWNIWIRSTGYTWCQNNPNGDPCRDVERVAIHEVGHVSGFLDHSSESLANTVMNASGAPLSGSTGGNVHTLLKCDAARMQMLYDLPDLNGPYADCFDDIPNAGAQGLDTVITATPTSQSTCSGDPVTISGRLDIFDGHYGRRTGNGTQANPYKWHLDGNALGGRTVTIKKSGVAYATTTATHVSGNNWSKVITLTSLTTVTINFTAQFVGTTADPPPVLLAGLDTSNVAAFSITVVKDVDC